MGPSKKSTKRSDDDTNNIDLNDIIENLPDLVYWKDSNRIYQGCNKNVAKILGYRSCGEIIGKSDLDLAHDFSWTMERVRQLEKVDLAIIREGISSFEEDAIPALDSTRIYLTSKNPLVNSDGIVIGILGISTDITDRKNMESALEKAKDEAESALIAMQKAQSKVHKHRKKAERLAIENATHKTQLEAEAQFARIVGQVFHDINSPLTSLKILEAHLSDLPEERRLPEQLRIELRRIIRRITDIINNLHRRSHVQNEGKLDIHEDKNNVLISALLRELLSEKSLEYGKYPIEFIPEFEPKSHFVFIEVQVSQFSRSFSNLINNAVQSFDGKEGIITLRLAIDEEYTHITIQDNGKGMPSELVRKIENKISFTHGKKVGHGIGLGQVQDMLTRNFGKLAVQSKPGEGSAITLSFPINQPPLWAIDTIHLHPNSIVIILDDDPSIHDAWDLNLGPILKEAPTIQVHHFEGGQETIDYIASINKEDRQQLVLLSDFELWNQDYNGLDVIKKVNVQRAILVTSHYAETAIQEGTIKANAKLLPKELAKDIHILLVKDEVPNQSTEVDAVWLEDNVALTTMTKKLFSKVEVDIYNHPNDFMANIAKYDLDTPIFLDNEYEGLDKSGISYAEDLHSRGFTKLTLVSGYRFKKDELPDYLNALSKADVSCLEDYIIKYKEMKK